MLSAGIPKGNQPMLRRKNIDLNLKVKYFKLTTYPISKFDFPYSDILVFHESQENDFLCVSKDVRNTQELFLSKFTI